KENLVGELNRGWYQVAVALDFERSGIQAYAGGRRTLERLVQFAREHPHFVARNPQVRYELADRWVELNVGYNIAYRITWMQAAGKIPNTEASVSKLYGSELSQRIARTGVALMGMHGELVEGKQAPLDGSVARGYMTSVASTVAAGTSEVQRGIIAGRGLGLPRG
ncbi:MAG TPA: acyl-CoA dehydrogenase family protein, partial [Dehalococcoidia bacterium]|nr:acyl-CoA dehydrogenase family protein [Dehalococcoidia bacterium]